MSTATSAPTATTYRPARTPAAGPRDNPIFAVAARATALRAQGVDVVTLAAGEPETPTASSVVAAAQQAAADPALHHYGPAAGLPALRSAVADQATASGVATTADQVQITQGAKHALFTALAVLTTPGDDVLVIAPGWPGHTEVVLAARAHPITVDTGTAPGLRLTAADLDRAWTPRTRALILANPGNPTGVLHDADELRAIADWCASRDVHLVADEVYSQLTSDHSHVPAAAAAPQHRDRITTIGAVSKAHAMTGWRVGWLITTPQRAADARRHVAATITHVPGINQAAAVAALADQDTPAQARETYRARRARLVTALNAVPGISCATPGGGMFAFPDVSGLLAPGQTAADLADHLLQTVHVATVPGDAFDTPRHLRVCFAVADDTLDEALSRLTTALTAQLTPTTQKRTILVSDLRRWRHVIVPARIDGVDLEIAAMVKPGHGTPLVFLHGFGSTKEDYADIACHPGLGDRPVLAYDAPGCGATRCPDLSAITVPFLAQVADTMIGHVGYQRFHLVGHSMGGLTALLQAQARPDRVASFVDIEGNIAPEDCFLSRQIVSHPHDDPQDFLTEFIDRLRSSRYYSANLYAASLPHKVRAGAVEPIFTSMVDLSDHQPLMEWFLDLPAPRMLMYGEQNNTLSYLPRLQAAGVELAEIAECGHFPMYANASEMWRRIHHFLTAAEHG